jgi:hypothetical protein
VAPQGIALAELAKRLDLSAQLQAPSG